MKTPVFLLIILALSIPALAQVTPLASIDDPDHSEYSPSISPDGRTLVFQSEKNGFWRIYASHMTDLGWGDAYEIFPGLPDSVFVGGPSFGADGKTLVFFGDMEGSFGSLDIFYVTYDSPSKSWSTPAHFPEPINSADYEGFPAISPSGNTLYFVVDQDQEEMAPGAEECYRIVMSEKMVDGNWSKPVPLPDKINEGCVGYPRIMPDGETLIFSRFEAEKKEDLFASVYTENGWSDPRAIEAVNTELAEKMVSVTYDGSQAVYSRGKDLNGVGPEDMIVQLAGNSLGEVAGWVGVRIDVRDESGKELGSTIAIREQGGATLKPEAFEGSYTGRLRAGKEYLLTITAPGYDFKTIPVDISHVTAPETRSYEVTLQSIKKELTIRLDDLNFDYNSASISDTAGAILEIAAIFLKENTNVKVEISAHTDNVGSPGFNLDLSNRRAASVVEALVAKGVSPETLIAKGYGETKPVTENETEEGRARNRRVEFRILEK